MSAISSTSAMVSRVPRPSVMSASRSCRMAEPVAARGAVAARLGGQEAQEVLGDVHHAGVLVHHDHAAGTHHRALGHERVEVHRHVELVRRQAAAGGAAGLHGLERLAAGDAAADAEDDLAQRHAHRHLDEAGVVDLADEREDLGARGALRPDGREPVGALEDDVGHVRPGLDVVEVGGPAPEALVGEVDEPPARDAAPAFERGHHGARLAADERAAAAADPQVEAVVAAEDGLAEQAELARLLDGARDALDGHAGTPGARRRGPPVRPSRRRR